MLTTSCFFIAIATGQKFPQSATSRDISELPPEDLLKLRVTSASNKEQALSKVGAALYVITREDIASSGANKIPDLLRLVPGVEVAQINANQWALAQARNYGAELSFHWTAARRWKSNPGYSFLQMFIQDQPGELGTLSSSVLGYSPKHHLQVRSVLNLPGNVEWNATLRCVSRLAAANVPSYVGADTTLRWRPREDVEVSVTGQNLSGPQRLEFGGLEKFLLPSPVLRTVFGKLTWHF